MSEPTNDITRYDELPTHDALGNELTYEWVPDTTCDTALSLDSNKKINRKDFTKNVAKIGFAGALVAFLGLKSTKSALAYYPCGGYWSTRCLSTGCQAAVYWCQRWCGASSYYVCSFDHWESHYCGGNC